MAGETPDIFKVGPFRPRIMLLEACRRVQLRDFTIRDSPMWTVHLAGCDTVLVRGLNILNGMKIPNSDGIDPDSSRNVTITDCHIESGDDCIVIKTSRQFAHYGPSENIVVSNCVLRTSSTALKIGTETVNDIRNVVFSNCIVRDSHRAVGIWLRDAGNIENVVVTNLVTETRLYPKIWWGAGETIYVSAQARTPGGKIGTLRGQPLQQRRRCVVGAGALGEEGLRQHAEVVGDEDRPHGRAGGADRRPCGQGLEPREGERHAGPAQHAAPGERSGPGV
jgi:polygalacturonase